MQEQPHWRRLLLRTEETADRYQADILTRPKDGGCPLCKFDSVIQEFEHWVHKGNKYPYDRYFEKSDMLVTKRHVADTDLTQAERDELDKLKKEVLYANYDSLLEHMPVQRSIPAHAHYHLIQFRRHDGQPR